MKEIKAFIRPAKAIEVYKGLYAGGFCCMTLTDCEGTGMYTEPDRDFPSLQFPFMHSKRVKIEIICAENDVAPIVEIIREHARTGRCGDGIIYVMEVEDVYRVKNSETGMQAIR